MYRQSQNVILNNEFLEECLASYNTNPSHALISAAAVGLWKSEDFNPTQATTLAELAAVECDFSGYARKGVTFSGQVNLSLDTPGIIGSVTFNCDEDSPQVYGTAYGFFITSTLGLVLCEKFPSQNAVPFARVGDFLNLDVAVPATANQATQ